MRDVNGHLLSTAAYLVLVLAFLLMGMAPFAVGVAVGGAWAEFYSWVYER